MFSSALWTLDDMEADGFRLILFGHVVHRHRLYPVSFIEYGSMLLSVNPEISQPLMGTAVEKTVKCN